MTEHGWERDEWPAIFEQVMAADILVLHPPIWLGEKSSVCTQVIERLYGNSHLLNDAGQYAYYGRVGGCLVTGNEDGAKHCAMNVLYSLQHLGYVIPPQADAGWIGEAGPGPSYLDEGSGGPGERLHEPQHDVHDLEPAAPRADAQGRRRHPGPRQPAHGLGRGLPLRLPEPGAPLSAVLERQEVDVLCAHTDPPAQARHLRPVRRGLHAVRRGPAARLGPLPHAPLGRRSERGRDLRLLRRTLEELERSQDDSDYQSRRERIDPLVEEVVANGSTRSSRDTFGGRGLTGVVVSARAVDGRCGRSSIELRAGDERAFDALVARHDGALRRVARTYVRTDAAADDVVQETWLGVIRGLAGFEGRSSLRTWIFRILVNRARTRAVREARELPFSALETR